MNVVSELFAYNACFSGCRVLAFCEYATISSFHTSDLDPDLTVFGEGLVLF